MNDGSHQGLIKPTKEETHEKDIHLTQLVPKLNRRYAYIPLQIPSDLTGTDGAWRGWSCIYLSYLMREAFNTLAFISDNLSTLHSNLQMKSGCLGNLKKRGKYDTRRQGKYWWKISSEDTYENRLPSDQNCFNNIPIRNTIS